MSPEHIRRFALDPSVRKLFRTDLKEQGTKLMSMISVAVGALSRPVYGALSTTMQQATASQEIS